jgi:hypothetical protein
VVNGGGWRIEPLRCLALDPWYVKNRGRPLQDDETFFASRFATIMLQHFPLFLSSMRDLKSFPFFFFPYVLPRLIHSHPSSHFTLNGSVRLMLAFSFIPRYAFHFFLCLNFSRTTTPPHSINRLLASWLFVSLHHYAEPVSRPVLKSPKPSLRFSSCCVSLNLLPFLFLPSSCYLAFGRRVYNKLWLAILG